MPRPRSWVMALALLAAGCSGVAPRPPALTQNRELEGFAAAAAYPNAEPAVALLAAQQYLAAHREQEGYELFQRLAREQPGRPILLSLEGMMQARMAGDVALLQRVGWVEEAIRKLDRAAEAERRHVAQAFASMGVRHAVLTTSGDWLRELSLFLRRAR